MGNQAYKIKAFTDDLLIMTENPKKSLSKIIEIIQEFGEVAGFKLNKTKTKLLVKNTSVQEK